MDDFYRAFGGRVRAARESLGLSQEHLAIRVGLSRASIANVERGAQRVALHQWLELATALDMNALLLLPSAPPPDEQLQRALRAEQVPPAVADWIEQVISQPESATGSNEEARDGHTSRGSS